jgi:transcriptional regulator with GAF, ATPase, and Fis domain
MKSTKDSEEQVRRFDWSEYFIPIAISAALIAVFFPVAKGFLESSKTKTKSEVRPLETVATPTENILNESSALDRDVIFHKMAKEGKSADQISQELDITYRGVIEKMKRHGYISKVEYEKLKKS